MQQVKNLLNKLHYNSPVILTFSFICFIALALSALTDTRSNQLLFMAYRDSPLNPLTYIRLFTHVLGHASYEHFINNILLVLVVGPPLEEKYGSQKLIISILITAFVSGLLQILIFPDTALLGASGIVFMLILMSSLAGSIKDKVPITLILVAVFYVGQEIVHIITLDDNVSQMAHIVGGVCGAVLGYAFMNNKGKKRVGKRNNFN